MDLIIFPDDNIEMTENLLFQDQYSIQDSLKRLPEVVQLNILDHYISLKAKEKKINWPNKISCLKDFNLFCLFYEKIANNGYIKIEISDLKYIKEKFPNIEINPAIFKNGYIKKMIEDVWKSADLFEHTNVCKEAGLKKRYAQVAGSFFTMSKMNEFTKEFKYYLTSFDYNPSFDFYIGYFDNRQKSAVTGNNKLKVKGYNNMCDIIVKKINHPTNVTEKFEYDCYKMFYSYDENQLYVHNSLIFKYCSMKMPSFFDIDMNFTVENLLEKNEFGRKKYDCVADQFTRILGYKMKGFYDSSMIDKELERGRQIVEKYITKVDRGSECNLCENHSWISLEWRSNKKFYGI